MIIPSGGFRIFFATEPVDFRKGMDGLVGIIASTYQFDPYDGAIWVFRSRRADRLKIIVWDGSGLILALKRLDSKRFVWPKPKSGPFVLSKPQFEAFFAGLDWRSLPAGEMRKPSFV